MKEYATFLIESLAKGVVTQNLDLGKVRLATGPKAEFNQLKNDFQNLTIKENGFLLHDLKLCYFSIGEKKYAAFINIEHYINDGIILDLLDLGVNKVDLNMAIFLCLFKDIDIKVIMPPGEIEQNILSQQESPEYDGVELDDLLPAVESISLFEIEPNSAFFDKDYPVLGYYLYSMIEKLIHLPIHAHLPFVKRVLLTNSKVPKENIFFFMTSNHWKHAFLELYRCVEGIYSIPRALELKRALGLTESASKIAKHCNSELGWRRREEDSLIRLMKNFSTLELINSRIDKVTFLQGAQNFAVEEKHASTCELVASKLYRLRNQLVHQGVEDAVTVVEDDWPTIIGFVLLMIDKIFIAYDAEI
ncbi:hypothetical protein JFR28_06990 [Serratia ureilytica]|uniref:hypothetical protein n=1 Tax=Serratia ureilytica TaxID=300181 RepID=UPI0018E83742|nr:hypothetical protein [Serratia ureilytica]MBJ2099300.1 hypothetical protein [Serratia ureilytica]